MWFNYVACYAFTPWCVCKLVTSRYSVYESCFGAGTVFVAHFLYLSQSLMFLLVDADDDDEQWWSEVSEWLKKTTCTVRLIFPDADADADLMMMMMMMMIMINVLHNDWLMMMCYTDWFIWCEQRLSAAAAVGAVEIWEWQAENCSCTEVIYCTVCTSHI